MMPQNLIKEIRNQQLNTGSEKWTYRTSGNVLELLVLPQFVHKKNAFRCSVIMAGQALAALKTQYNKAGEELFIQTFPNIENPQIICSIRADDLGYSISDAAPEPVIFENKGNSIDEYLQKTAESFHLYTQNAYLSKGVLELVSDETRFNHTFFLLSKLDNPFMWLNVGYWKEAISQYMKLHELKRDFFLYHFSNSREEFKKRAGIKSGAHLQGIIGY